MRKRRCARIISSAYGCLIGVIQSLSKQLEAHASGDYMAWLAYPAESSECSEAYCTVIEALKYSGTVVESQEVP